MAEVLFTSASRRRSRGPAGGRDPSRPIVDLVAIVSCGDPQVAPLLALAVAALPSPLPRTLVAALTDAEPENGDGWLPRLGSAGAHVAELEQRGGRALVVSPPRDGPGMRALGLAAARHLVWAGPGEAGRNDLAALLAVLEMGAPRPRVGWLAPCASESAGPAGLLAAWSDACPGREITALGCWRPGEPLPASLCSFLASPGEGAGPLTWALSLLTPRPAGWGGGGSPIRNRSPKPT